jgi:predicted dehydrogenase
VTTFDRRYAVAFAAELEHFARSVIDGTPPLVTGRDALAAFDLAAAAEQSCRLGRSVSMNAGGQVRFDGGAGVIDPTGPRA